MDAAKFYWAVVGDASPEPVAVVEENGRRVAYTCGCPDPFEVDGPEASIVLIAPGVCNNGFTPNPEHYDRPDDAATRSIVSNWVLKPLTIPPTPSDIATKQSENEARLRREKARGISHGHRRFNP